MNPETTVAAVVLAAGLGKRMGADMPKVMLEWRGRPLIRWVTDALRGAGIDRIILVIGFKGELVEQEYTEDDIDFVWQHERLGTAHAVQQAEPLLNEFDGEILVALGDVPRIKSETIRTLLKTHITNAAAATILTTEMPDPSGYGRVIRASDGSVDRIVEHRDASDAERQIKEINSGVICFHSKDFWKLLRRIGNDNDQKEFYLTDAIELLCQNGQKIMAHCVGDFREIMGVNTKDELDALG